MGQAGIVKLAYERKRENNWSVLEAAEFIEAHGGKVPPLMLEQIKADLRAPKTNTDDEENQTASGAPSLEDLDKIARERAASRRADAALWIEHRREEIADIVDTGGYGDVDAEGISNEAWLNRIWTKTRRKTKKLPANCTGMMINGQKLRNGPTLARAGGAISL